jgi:hypothetical protein
MKFWLKKAKERNYLKNLRVDGSLVSTWILRKWEGTVWRGFI